MSDAQIERAVKEIGYFRRAVEPGIAYGIKMIFGVKNYLKIKDFKKVNLLVIAETSRCLPDAIQFLCGCTIGNRRLVIKDVGKMAATLIDRDANRAVRVTISPTFQKRDVIHSRKLIQLKEKLDFTEIESRRLQDSREILKTPNNELLRIQEVEITEPLSAIFMPSGIILCEKCGESIRESKVKIEDGKKICLVCAGVEKPYFKLKYGAELL
jgi:formylmethanofuran dehydrogenase subunit E